MRTDSDISASIRSLDKELQGVEVPIPAYERGTGLSLVKAAAAQHGVAVRISLEEAEFTARLIFPAVGNTKSA